MKSIEVEINGKMTPVCFADDVDKVTSEMRERHEVEIKRLEAYWKGVLEAKELEWARERIPPPPKTFFDEVCQVVRTCEKDGNPAPAYDFLRGISAGWWLCNEINSPPEQAEDQIRKWLNQPKEK